MTCELLDFRCILVSEIFGSVLLAGIALFILYLIVANKLKFGFDTTLVTGAIILMVIGLSITGFPVIYAFATVLAGILIAWIVQEVIKN